MNYENEIEELIRKQIEEAETKIEITRQWEKYINEQD